MQHANEGLSRVLAYIGLSFAEIKGKVPTLAGLDKLTLDSRITDQSTIFIAIHGEKQSGHAFIAQAAKMGCRVALVETKKTKENNWVELKRYARHSLLCIHVYALRTKLADIAYCFYKLDESSLPNVTAITGTNGKTSVASFIAQLSSLCKQKSASIGTLGVNIFTNGEQQKLVDTINTTPDIISLVGTLSTLQQKGCQQLSLEASSHGLAQDRLDKLNVNCVVFTNLSQDHLDYHHTMDAYASAKRKLLNASGVKLVILNANDNESKNWQAQCNDNLSVFWYSLDQLDENYMGCWASDINYSTEGIEFTLNAKFSTYAQSCRINVAVIGAFNVANLLASITALLAQSFSFVDIKNALSHLHSVAGRMELFKSDKGSLLVDYAHTPDALRQALSAARIHTKGLLSCVFGCGGDRDISKRAIMGEIAVQYADNIVLTQDNSRSEDPMHIIADIKKGMGALTTRQKLHVELDREQALLHAWQQSTKNDMIVVAGKGHEDYIEINNTRIAYNERQVVATLASRNIASVNFLQTQGGDE